MIQILTWILEEWAWNVYPSTRESSLAVVGVYTAVLAGVWWNWGGQIEQIIIARERADNSGERTLKAE